MASACMHCGCSASGEFFAHRDGLDRGPVLPLCVACGGPDSPAIEEIWTSTSQLVWVESAVVAQLLEQIDPDLVAGDRAVAWQVVLAAAFASSTVMTTALQLRFDVLFDKVAAAVELQRAVTAAHRFASLGYEIVQMVMAWVPNAKTNKS